MNKRIIEAYKKLFEEGRITIDEVPEEYKEYIIGTKTIA